MKTLHFNDKTGGLFKQDELQKIKPLVSMICEKYREICKPGLDLVIDEIMIVFIGRLVTRQFLP